MAVIFGGNVTDSLASLRYKSLGKKVITAKSFINPEQLPPTESATMYHSQRVYYQMMDDGMDWDGKGDESGGLGMETGRQQICSYYDGQSSCPRKSSQYGPL